MAETGYTGALKDADPRTLAAGDLEAVFLPGAGMIGASLRHKGVEVLGRVEDLEAAAAKGSTGGIPLLHPWANRLAGYDYRAAGREVTLDPNSDLLHKEEHGLPIHGAVWARLKWQVTDVRADRLAARLDWSDPALLAVFPFHHRLEMTVALDPDGLTIETTLVAGSDGPVPVSFGFHPYFSLPGVPRAEWRLSLPAMRRLSLDDRQIPTGAKATFAATDGPIGTTTFDDGFALTAPTATLAIEGGGRRIAVEFREGYPYAQVFVPPGRDFVALEPMTAPTNALASGDGLHLVAAGDRLRATFRVGVSALT